MKMLPHCTRLCVSMFIILELCQVSSIDVTKQCHKPIISPNSEKIIINEEEVLWISCNSSQTITIIFPDNRKINTSTYLLYHDVIYEDGNKIHTLDFARLNTVFGDTGWYGCADSNIEITNFNGPEVNWLYVYVKSNTSLFVDAHDNAHLNATTGDNIVVPCRTTSPHLQPKLINDKEDEVNKTSYDPKFGFTIQNLSLDDSGSYKCLIKMDKKEYMINYVLSVYPKQVLTEPKIQTYDVFIKRIRELYVNCTAEMKVFVQYIFDWNMREQNSSRRNIEQFSKHFDGYSILDESLILMAFETKDEKSSDYECSIKTSYHKKEMTKEIWISYLNSADIPIFSLFMNTSYYQNENVSDIEWTAFLAVNSNFSSDLYWFTSNGAEIIQSNPNLILFDSIPNTWRFDMFKKSHLKIFSLDILASGNYTLEIENENDMIKNLTVILDVIDKPTSVLKSFYYYYLPNENKEFRCEVTSNPPPNITWNFLKCPNYPSLENSTIVYLTNVTQSASNNSIYRFESIVKMPINVSGKITCEACNEVGCDSVTQNILVSKPVPPYFTKTNMNKTKTKIIDMITEGYKTMILQCYADGIPKPTVTWYKDDKLLKQNDQYFFTYNNEELHIKYLMQHDSGKYSCRAVSRLDTIETYQQITVKNTKWNTLEIILVTLIPILSFILIIITIYFTIKIYREKRKREKLMEAGLLNFEEGALECLDPNLTIDEQAELLPYDKKWEFPRDRLKLREQLGSGNFGMVMKAEAIGICKNENVSTVAVKMVRRNTDPIYIRALVSELKIMMHLGKHLNVVNLLGACTNNISKCELLVIIEYCRFGNLYNYLLSHRNDFINQINPTTRKHDFTIGMDVLMRNVNVNNDNSSNGNSDIDVMAHKCLETNSDSPEINFLSDCISDNLSQQEWRPNHCNNPKDQNIKPICTQDLLSWAFQVARGMEYLSQRKILHGDLAARNILLAEDNIVKISDFGFAKIMYKEDNYKKKSAIPMPIKWMAVESIRNRIFSTQSDVWSFGIMLWEFFTLAETPYSGSDIMILHQKLIEGYRMEQPDYAIDEIYEIMLQCWIAKPTLRPSFKDLVESIGNLLEESVKMHYIILNNPYMDINTMNLKNGKDNYLMMTSAPDHEVLSSIYKCENLLSKGTSNSTYLYMRSGCSLDESKTFNPRPHEDHSNIELLSLTSDSEEAIELPPVPEHKENLSEADQCP